MNDFHSDDIMLEWQHLSYKVESSKFNWSTFQSTKTTINVLKDVSGSVSAGQLVAIVGPSGSGKTTLLAAISQRLRGNISGTISLNGSLVRQTEMADRSSFIPQFDVSSEFLTVYEHMCFVYKLKNCAALGPKNAYIHGILRSLGLNKVAQSRIQVLSGGERKKLLLATELLIDPSIIFCDEPTTGLDSFSALSVLSALQQLVGNTDQVHIDRDEDSELVANWISKKLVICSIHQPSSAVFACFSHVILMQEGRIAFQGTVAEAEEFFASFGFICATLVNRADFFVKKLSEKLYDSNHNLNSRANTQPLEVIVENDGIDCCDSHVHQEHVRSKRHTSWCYQTVILTHMLGLEAIRNKTEFIFKLITFVITALFVALLYNGTNDVDQTAIQDINGFVIIMTSEITLSTAYNILFYYPSKLPILRREIGEAKFSLSAFYVAYLLCSMPKSIIECFVFLAVIFPFTQFLRGFWMFLKIGFTLSLIATPGTAYGLMLSGLFESSMVATSLAPPFDVALVLIGGIYGKMQVLSELKYLSMFYYAAEALSIVIWNEANALSCSPNVFNTCFSTGTDVLHSLLYKTTYSFLLIDYAGLIATAAVMNLIGFWGIRRMVMKSGFY